MRHTRGRALGPSRYSEPDNRIAGRGGWPNVLDSRMWGSPRYFACKDFSQPSADVEQKEPALQHFADVSGDDVAHRAPWLDRRPGVVKWRL
jgi:hypothetical protein